MAIMSMISGCIAARMAEAVCFSPKDPGWGGHMNKINEYQKSIQKCTRYIWEDLHKRMGRNPVNPEE